MGRTLLSVLMVYTFNRFQACRFGYAGTYVDPGSHEQRSLAEDLTETFMRIEQHAIELGADEACQALLADVASEVNDADRLRSAWQDCKSLPEIVQGQCALWRG